MTFALSHPHRTHTQTNRAKRSAVLVPTGAEFNRDTATAAWVDLKERQRLEDGTSARIEACRLTRLEKIEDLDDVEPQPPAEKKTPEEIAAIPRRNGLCAKLGPIARGATQQ